MKKYVKSSFDCTCTSAIEQFLKEKKQSLGSVLEHTLGLYHKQFWSRGCSYKWSTLYYYDFLLTDFFLSLSTTLGDDHAFIKGIGI